MKTLRNKCVIVPLLCVLSFAAQEVFAQERVAKNFPRNEFRAGVAWCPFVSSWGFFTNENVRISQDGGAYTDNCKIPYFSVSYEYYFKKWFSLSGVVGTSATYRQVKMNSEAQWEREVTGTLAFIVMPRFTFFSRDWVRLYAALSLGVYLPHLCPSAQIVPLGVSFGSKFFGFAEIGAGTDYLGGNFGVGYRF